MSKESSKLPLLISVPHGGQLIPPKLIKKCLLTKEEILLDCDTWSHELYGFRGLVEEYVDTPIARIVLDMNRAKDDLPPGNPDGVVKTLSVERKKVWDIDGGLTKEETDELIREYYINYHRQLEVAATNPNVVLAIDCHTMLDIGPAPNGAQWEKRPLFCLGNRGSETGQPQDESITAPVDLIQKCKQLLEEKFSDYASGDDTVPLVTLNQPFKGGYITRYHGNKGNLPWIQLEMNRRLYLPYAKDTMVITPTESDAMKLRKIRDDLFDVFEQLLAWWRKESVQSNIYTK